MLALFFIANLPVIGPMTACSSRPINILGFFSSEIRARTFKLNNLNNNFSHVLSEHLKQEREKEIERKSRLAAVELSDF